MPFPNCGPLGTLEPLFVTLFEIYFASTFQTSAHDVTGHVTVPQVPALSTSCSNTRVCISRPQSRRRN